MISDLFIITSVINTGNKPWSYTSLRSCFSIEERFNQTLHTIKSIRDLNDNSKILLVECSDINDNMTNLLKEKVDYFIQTYNNPDVHDACLQSNKKGYGEVQKVKIVCDYIIDNNIVFNRLFKISGRYYLNSSFDKSNYNTTSFTFKFFGSRNGSTVLYSLPYSLFSEYRNKINEIIYFYKTNPPTGLETLLPNICNPVSKISTLGVSGYVAILNDNGSYEFYTA